MYQPDDLRTLFVGDLSVYCSENDLQTLFSQFGPIEKITIKRGVSGSTNLSYGFVKFYHRESAEAATAMKGMMFLGRAIRIGWAGPRTADKPIKPKEGPSRRDTAQIHVSFISKQVDALITEETLRSLFGHYGTVVDVALKKSKFDPNLRIQNGYGFIHFPLTSEGIQSALVATREVHQITVDRVIYDCTLSHLLESYLTPEQIAFAYSSPTPPAFRGRPYERKREMYAPQPPTPPALYHPHKPRVETSFPSDYSLLNSSFFSTTTNDDGASNSSGLTSHMSSWESATWSKFLNNNNGNNNRHSATHRRSPSNETNLFSLESVTDVDVSVDKLDLNQLLGLQEPSSPNTTSSLNSDTRYSDVSDHLPLPMQPMNHHHYNNSMMRPNDYQLPLVPLEERFHSDFFKSWN